MRLVLYPNGYSGPQLVNATLARAGEGVVLVRRGPQGSVRARRSRARSKIFEMEVDLGVRRREGAGVGSSLSVGRGFAPGVGKEGLHPRC